MQFKYSFVEQKTSENYLELFNTLQLFSYVTNS